MYVWFFIVCLLKLSFALSELKKNDPCTTPNNKSGTCTSVNNCQVIYNAITSRNYTVLNFAKKSYCGFDNEALVCCEHPSPVEKINLNKEVLPETCGVVKEEERIIGGETTKMGEFPWMVALEYRQKKNGRNAGVRCGGTLINEEYVMTAAYCLQDREYEVSRVLLGEWQLSTDPDCVTQVANKNCADPIQAIEPRETIVYPFYSRRLGYNDIALIQLKTKVNFTDFVSPICLASEDAADPETGKMLTVAGWGTTLNGSASDVLLKVSVPLVSKEECKKYLESANRHVIAQQICAGGEELKDTCRGDGGGPLMQIDSDQKSSSLRYVQYGITSWGVGCARESHPAVYTRIASYRDWIENVIASEG